MALGKKEHTTLEKKFAKSTAIIANFIISVAASYCIATFAYFFYFYGWTNQRYFTSWVGPSLYYIAPVVCAVSLIAAFWLKSSYRINLALALCATFGSLYLAEIGVFIVSEGGMSFFAKAHAFDTRSKLEVINQLNKQGTYAVPSVSPALLLFDSAGQSRQSPITIDGKEVVPLGGIANTLTVFCNETGKYLRYESDEHGFHNPKGLWQTGHTDIVALGDSFTQGFCVPSEKNFVSLIRERYRTTINLGGSGDGPLLELAKLKEYAQYLQPKIVLWFFFEGNDWEDLPAEETHPLLRAYLTTNFTQDLRSQQSAIDAALTAWVEKAKSSDIWRGRADRGLNLRLSTQLLETVKFSSLRHRLSLVTARKAHKPPQELPVALFVRALAEAHTMVNGWGGTMYFVYLPAGGRYVDPKVVGDYTGSGQYIVALNARDHVLEIVGRLGIPLIDIHTAFRAQSGDPLSLFSFRDPIRHYTELGHMLVAQESLRVLSCAHPWVGSAQRYVKFHRGC
jgi:hypothetical protein